MGLSHVLVDNDYTLRYWEASPKYRAFKIL